MAYGNLRQVSPADLKRGQYRLIGWDIDTTGRRLMDEMFQMAAYYPNAKYSQYIMPYKALTLFAERRYNIQVVQISRFRMLKDLKRNKILKTKSEVASLNYFITWLENNRGEFSDGIILVYHDVKNISPAMLLEALKRYDLFKRFAAVVKGFCNTCIMAEIQCAGTLNSFSLKVLSQVLLNEETDFNSAVDRAKASYNLVLTILYKQIKSQDSRVKRNGAATITEQHLSEFAKQFSCSTGSEERDLIDLKMFLERQKSLLPIFKGLMRYDWANRQNASRLRCKLVENNVDYNQLKKAWDDGGKKSLIEILRTLITTTRKDYFDLLRILECYFDPDKKPVKANFYKRRRTVYKPKKKYY